MKQLPSSALTGFAACALSFAACSTARSSVENPAGHTVVVLSIDALRPEFYQDPAWEAPTLQRLREQGAWATRAEPIFPTVTYPNHTMLVTGAYGDRSGVPYNTVFSLEHGLSDHWAWESSLIQVPTLWEKVKASGRTAALLSWPVTVGADARWVIADVFPPGDHDPGHGWEAIRRQSQATGFAEIDAHVDVSHHGAMDSFAKRDRWMLEAATYLIREQAPALVLIHVVAIDSIQHAVGRDAPATHRALAELDSALKPFVAALDPRRVTLVVTGDHGFEDHDRDIRINRLFAERGWIQRDPSTGRITGWKAIAQGDGGAAAVYIKGPSLRPAVLRALRSRASGRYDILDRARLDELHAFPGAAFALNVHPPFTLTENFDGPVLGPRHEVRGHHGELWSSNPHLYTGLIAWGEGVAAGKRLGETRQIDVAPTLARLLGVPLPDAVGRPLELAP